MQISSSEIPSAKFLRSSRDMEQRIYGFPPVYRSDAVVLILGSMPSVESLRQSFYYAHPRNAFWRIVSDIFGESLPVTVEEKKDMLLRHKIALWDTVGSCKRVGSLDSAIRSAIPNDFSELFASCPKLQTIFFNGASAQKLFVQMVNIDMPAYRMIRLPSTSPAYTLPYEKKLSAWKSAFEEANK